MPNQPIKEIIVFCVLILVFVGSVFSLYLTNINGSSTPTSTGSPPDYRSGFRGYCGTQTFIEVDSQLQAYIQITAPNGGSFSSAINNETRGGTVTWIGSATDSIQSLQNIHLVMYTHWEYRNSTENFPDTSLIGVHIVAYPNEPTLPADTYDSAEVIIPNIGVNMPTFSYDLSCLGPTS